LRLVEQQPQAPFEVGAEVDVGAELRVRGGDRRREVELADLVGERLVNGGLLQDPDVAERAV
jgi:hypothetical protein